MDINTEKNAMLDLLTRPGFCVEDGVITRVNHAAATLLLTPGTQVSSLLLTGGEELADFQDGCLYLKLNLAPGGMDAFVTRIEGNLVFLLDPQPEQELQALSLASRELRSPLSSMMISTARINAQEAADPLQEDLNRLSRGLFQTLRLLGNMSDAGRLPDPGRQETINLSALFDEIFEKGVSAAADAGIRLTWQGLNTDIYSLADTEQLERAVLNILSNAMKFTPKGGEIHASLTRRGHTLRLQVADTGSGIAPEVRSTLFHRYQRQPGIEDARFGLGLGMVIIRNAAAAHEGTVLVDQSREGGARVTMTLSIRKAKKDTLRCPMMRVDYAGEWDHLLVELSDVLPPECYKKEI